MSRIPEVNLLDDGMKIKIRSHNVEIIVSSNEEGNIIIKHENDSPIVYFGSEDAVSKFTKSLEITR